MVSTIPGGVRSRPKCRRFVRPPTYQGARRNYTLSIGSNLVLLAGLVIGLVYGAAGLLSGFCLMSSLRGWWGEGDKRLVRTYALAMGLAIAATQLLAAGGLVDLGKSIYLQASF